MAKRTVGSAASKKKTTTKKKTTRKPSTSAKPGKKDHPLIGTKDEEVYPFKETPEDFDPKKHNGLKLKDFKSKSCFLVYKAELHEAVAKQLRLDAADVAKTGDKSQRRRVNKLKKLREQQAELTKLLEEQGVDVDSILDDEEEDGDEE